VVGYSWNISIAFSCRLTLTTFAIFSLFRNTKKGLVRCNVIGIRVFYDNIILTLEVWTNVMNIVITNYDCSVLVLLC